MKQVLLVNPWIYDFAAYDFWLKPWGLLKLSSVLRSCGCDTRVVDVLDRHNPLLSKEGKDHGNKTGKFFAEEVVKPDALKNIPRVYKRYGFPIEVFEELLPSQSPDYIMVSSGMTYWYPGAFEAIKFLKEKYPKAPVILGGVYATLCYEHAVENSGADMVVKNHELEKLNGILDAKVDLSFRNILDAPLDMDCYKAPQYAVLRVSMGCPFDCSYCAQKRLSPAFMTKTYSEAISEIEMLYGLGIRHFAFYDDALLFDEEYIKKYMLSVVSRKMEACFYTPNGLHARYITAEIAGLMKNMNFVNPMLSLETTNAEKEKKWHEKVTTIDFEKAVENLKKAGYKNGDYSTYMLFGAPGSSLEEVKNGIDFANSLGAKVSLSEYSFVPGTKMAQAEDKGTSEPLLQNNSIYGAMSRSDWDNIMQIKNYARLKNRELAHS